MGMAFLIFNIKLYVGKQDDSPITLSSMYFFINDFIQIVVFYIFYLNFYKMFE